MSDFALQVMHIDLGHLGDKLSAYHPYHPQTYYWATKSFCFPGKFLIFNTEDIISLEISQLLVNQEGYIFG